MIINGREIGFLRTVKATSELSKICPDQDISRLTELFNGNLSTTLETGAKMIHFLNEGYEMHKHFMDRSYKPQILEVEEILNLEYEQYNGLLASAMKGLTNGTETTIEVEESKKKVKPSAEAD